MYLDTRKLIQTFVFPEWCLPGRQNDRTTCTSILHPSRASQLPYSEEKKNQDLGGFGIFPEKKVLKLAQEVPGPFEV